MEMLQLLHSPPSELWLQCSLRGLLCNHLRIRWCFFAKIGRKYYYEALLPNDSSYANHRKSFFRMSLISKIMCGETFSSYTLKSKQNSTGTVHSSHGYLSHFRELQQSAYDPCLLCCSTNSTAILLCTDDMLVAIPQSKLPTEGHITDHFKSRDFEHLPTDFKGLSIGQSGTTIRVSQQSYLDELQIFEPLCSSKPDRKRPMTDNDFASYRTAAVRFSYLPTATSPWSAFVASVSLEEDLKPLSSFFACQSRPRHGQGRKSFCAD